MEEKTITSRKIAIVGPESSGKTTLCQKLSLHFKGDWVPEFARIHLETHPIYNQTTLDFFVQEQLKLEDSYESEILFCDTEAISIKVWSVYKYGSFSQEIERAIKKSDYDYYLLLKPDIAYVADSQREDAPLKNRIELFELFKSELKKYERKFSVVQGNNELRINNAIEIIKSQISF